MKAIDYIQDFKEKACKEKSKNTSEAYFSDLKQFLFYLKKDIEEVKSEDIEVYKNYLLVSKLEPKTVNRKLVSIRRFIDFLNNLNVGIMIHVEIRQIKIQKQEYLEELLTKSDFDRLINAAESARDKRALAIFNGLYLTGARVSELLQIKISDANNDEISVKGKGAKYRFLFPPDRLKDYFNNYIRIRRITNSEMLFLNELNHNPMDRQSIHNLIKKYAGISKVKLSRAHAHNFRHLYAFKLIEEGLSLAEVAELLGHTDINTTKIYTRKTKAELKKTIKSL